ncbi:MAG: hypothetical protein ABR613_10650 [Actinomycetota bacterium]
MRHIAVAVVVLMSTAPARSQPVLDCPAWQIGQHLGTGTRAGVRDLVHDFVRAYNRGDLARLDEIFPQEPGFEGYYAEPERQWEEGEDRSTLIDYFERRHALDDRLDLRVLRIQKKREQRGWEFYFELQRGSGQRRARGGYVGKGAADCALSVWNMSRPRG